MISPWKEDMTLSSRTLMQKHALQVLFFWIQVNSWTQHFIPIIVFQCPVKLVDTSNAFSVFLYEVKVYMVIYRLSRDS